MERNLPLIGDKFPNFEAQTTHGIINLPEDMKGKWFVLFSHPGDFTPVCTTEFYSFAKNADRFKELNCELVGLSVDQVFSHIKWAEWIEENLKQEIPFPIVADDMGKIAVALGMIHPAKGANTVRAVFIVDPNGILRTVLYYPQELGRNIEEILRIVKALQASAENKGAMPANWPDNELLKDRVIVPPASNVKAAKENSKKYDCYDWWFCHKELKK